MHILKPHMTLFITALTIQAFVPVETGMSQVPKQICDTACYNAYHYLMGDYHTSEDWPDYATSHQSSADQICWADLCSGCPFCSLHQDTYDNTLNFKISLENRHDADDDKLISCLDCQKYVDSCLISAKEEASNVRDDLECELEVCTKGPVHCHSGGQCERLICKGLVARTKGLPPSDPLCKPCTSLWLKYVQAICFPPNQDCFTTTCIAPHRTCAALCWSMTPRTCQTDQWCAHPIYANIKMNSYPHTLAEQGPISATQSIHCNDYRQECLETCDVQQLQDKCNSTCDSKRRVGEAQAKMCRDDCVQGISCYQYCMEKICCVGPEHCRVAGNHYRCGDIANVQCEFWKHASSGLSP